MVEQDKINIFDALNEEYTDVWNKSEGSICYISNSASMLSL